MNSIKTTLVRVSLLALPLAFGLQSCKDSFFDVNTTPNNPTSVPATVLLTTVEYDAAFTTSNDLDRIAEVFVQHAAGVGNQVAAYDVYNIRGASDNQWNGELYAGWLINAQQIINLNQTTSPAYAGIAKILKAYGFSVTTNLWGDIPYSQALQGTTTLSPRLDKQQDIYLGNSSLGIQSLFDLVKEGLADLDKPNTGIKPGVDDVAYLGDLAKWKRLGNTMLMKFAIIISRKDPATAKTMFEAALASPAGVINDNALDFQVGFGTDVNKQNPIYSFNYVNRPTDGMASSRFVDTLTLYKDPRISKFYTTAASPVGTYVGFNNGSGSAPPPLAVNRSRYGTYLIGTSGEAPIRMITNFQRAFMQAEAVLTLGVAGTAQTFYQEGIKASMSKAGISTADINTYFTANPAIVTLSGSKDNQLRQVMTQKWIANFGIGLEAYDDYRRTNYPALAQVLNPAGDDQTRPVRLPYTDNEIQRNPAITVQPKTNEKLWWDVD